MAFSNPIVGDEALIRDSVQSSNYTAGSTGWKIGKDGSAEFSGATFRGTVAGNGYIINQNGVFLYAGTPALHSIVGSWTSVAGTDQYGNAYPAGLALYDGTTGTITNFLGGPGNIVYNIQGSEWVGFGFGNIILDAEQDPSGPFNSSTTGQLSIIGDNSAVVLSSPQRTQTLPQLLRNAFFYVHAGRAGSVTGDSDFPYTMHNGTDLWVRTDSSILACEYLPGHFDPTPVTWKTPTLATGWVQGPGSGGAYPPLQYHLRPDDSMYVFGTMHVTSTTPGNPWATGFPAVNQTTLGGVGVIGTVSIMQGTNAGKTASCYINNAGELRPSFVPAVAVGDTFMFNAIVPLGNVP